MANDKKTSGQSTGTVIDKVIEWSATQGGKAFVVVVVVILIPSLISVVVTVASPFLQEGPNQPSANPPPPTAQSGGRVEIVKSATCLLTAKTTEPKTSVAKSLELKVDLSVPLYAKECEATVTIDAPTFGLGKDTSETVSIVPPPKSDERRWLLEPEKVGRWQIAVETKEQRKLVPVLVTTPLGLTAPWAQVGTIAGVVSGLALGALGLWLKRE